ncbi:glycosyltransferase family 2 protein [Herbaspirillum sp. NPDC087042]|uniref:glycosyltransferase family 2 protein n=1 Tax=Herbaspirillum sp. NPDC087042 TaxID=3364004 RepID=UPI0038295C39
MSVYVIVPVFNRLAMTQGLVTCLRAQVVDEDLQLIVVDDGSTDGTGKWLDEQKDIDVLRGDGSLFWGGAVDLAFRSLQSRAGKDDWVLLMNNDTAVAPNFVMALLRAARNNAPAAVGSIVRDEVAPHRLLSLGAKVNAWRFLTSDLQPAANALAQDQPLPVDVLSGRGVLFPWAGLVAAGGMRPRRLPHYFADYEVSLRVRRKGWRLLVAPDAAVLSADEYGSARVFGSLREKLCSIRSPAYLPALATFWWEASNWPQRLTMPLRICAFTLFPGLRKRTSKK